MKFNLKWENFFAGAIAGLVGAILSSEFSWSFLSVGIIGALTGVIVLWIFSLFKK
jgi:ammonia channel protein AmtB